MLGGLTGAGFIAICTRAVAFRAKHVRPHLWRWALEPVVLLAAWASVMLLLPAAYGCVRADCPDLVAPGCARVGPVVGGWAYGCPAGHYNQAASLMLPEGAAVIKTLFARGIPYQFDYGALAAFFLLYVPAAAYTNGIACSTGLFYYYTVSSCCT